MPLPTRIELPSSAIIQKALDINQQYSVTYNLKENNIITPNAGIFLGGAASGNLISGETQRGQKTQTFTAYSSAVQAAFLLGIDQAVISNKPSPEYSALLVGQRAGEFGNNNPNNPTLAGNVTMKLETTGDVVVFDGPATTWIELGSGFEAPFLFDITTYLQQEDKQGVTLTRVSAETNVVISFHNLSGELVGLFDADHSDPIYLPIAYSPFAVACLVGKQNGDEYDFEIGDPRTDGTMSFSEA